MAEQEQATNKQLAISKIYIKDFSFESPQSPQIFKGGEWKPETNLNLRSVHNSLEGNAHEVVLTITVEAKDGDKSMFLVELQQAGIFEIAGYEGDELGAIVGSFCPNILCHDNPEGRLSRVRAAADQLRCAVHAGEATG